MSRLEREMSEELSRRSPWQLEISVVRMMPFASAETILELHDLRMASCLDAAAVEFDRLSRFFGDYDRARVLFRRAGVREGWRLLVPHDDDPDHFSYEIARARRHFTLQPWSGRDFDNDVEIRGSILNHEAAARERGVNWYRALGELARNAPSITRADAAAVELEARRFVSKNMPLMQRLAENERAELGDDEPPEE